MPDIQVVFNQQLYGQEVRNVCNFFTDGALTPTNLQDIADYIRSNWVASGLGSNQVNNWQLYGVSIRDANIGGPYAELAFTAGVLAGNNTTHEAPSQNCLLVSLINSGLTPPTRGRIYLAGVGVSGMENTGLWSTVITGKGFALVDGLVNATTAGGLLLDLRIGRMFPDGTLDVSNVVNNVIARPIPATQRRRRIGVGS